MFARGLIGAIIPFCLACVASVSVRFSARSRHFFLSGSAARGWNSTSEPCENKETFVHLHARFK